MFQLRQFQTDLKNDVYKSWNSGKRNVITVAPTGAGKTVIMSDIAKDVGEPTVAIAHRQELVQQISLAMARMDIPHNIVAPDKIVKVVINQHIKACGMSYLDRRGQMTVAGVNTLWSRRKDLVQWANTIRYWEGDECFPAGTLVDGRPIEKIKVGDFVRAFDDCTGGVVLSRVTRLFKNPAPSQMVDIRAGHHVITSTKGHPFFTQRGWVIASEIKTSDRILVEALCAMRETCRSDDRKPEVRLAKARANILHEEVCVQVSRYPHGAEEISFCDGDMLDMFSASAGVTHHSEPVQESRDGVLQHGMFNDISSRGIVPNHGHNQPKACVETDDGKQPDEVTRDAEKGVGHSETHRTSAVYTWRKRSACYPGGTKADVSALRERVHGAVCCKDAPAEYGIPDALQNRLRQSETEDCDRSGWWQSLCDNPTGTRPSQGRVLNWQRVDGVSVYEPTDNDKPADGFVYNIEVDEFHTYFANGIVVHNCHHFLQDNQWGRAVSMFPHARGVGFTASPVRCDRKSLHVDQGGVFDDMVVGPSMRDLIDDGFLSDYRIFGVPQSISESDLTISSNTGDFTGPSMRAAAEKSTITGDIVEHYLKIAPGKRGITFCVDVEQANKTAQAFRDAGVPAEAVSAKTPDAVRNSTIDKFRRGIIFQLVNVDLFGEGFDVPAVEVVSMARPTQSFGLFIQQFGRALRLFDGKEFGIIIDHVGNVKRHGLPDAVRGWTLFNERAGKRGAQMDPNVMPTTSCVECFRTYEAITNQCPFCGNISEPESRSAPEFIDGDLIEFSPELLEQLRHQAAAAHAPFNPKTDVPGHLRGTPAEHRLASLAGNRQVAHHALSDAISWWAGVRRQKGMGDSEIYRRFYHTFGVDVLTAQGIRDRIAVEQLTCKIIEGYWS